MKKNETKGTCRQDYQRQEIERDFDLEWNLKIVKIVFKKTQSRTQNYFHLLKCNQDFVSFYWNVTQDMSPLKLYKITKWVSAQILGTCSSSFPNTDFGFTILTGNVALMVSCRLFKLQTVPGVTICVGISL